MSGCCIGFHMFIYKEGGKLAGCGKNRYNQLGNGNEKEPAIPKPIMNDNQIEMICCGEYHSLLLRQNHDVLVCGNNQYGQLGLGKEIEKVSVFTLLLKDIPINKIQCGEIHSLILKKNSNEFITFGTNYFGQLGIGTSTKCEYELQTIKMASRIVEIVTGANHTIIQLLNHEVYVFGKSECAQLGTGDREEILSPKLIFKDSTIKKIACGYQHTIYLKENGDLIGNGDNYYGQLSIPNQKNVLSPTFILNDREIKEIFCGAFHTLFLKNNGELFGFGNNERGQLGIGDKENRNKPTLIMKDENIKQICCFGESSMILKNNGDSFVFGRNFEGQLGIGNKKDQLRPKLLNRKNEKIEMIMGNKRTPIEWSKENHKQFSKQFQIQTETFLLSLRIFSNLILKQKVPKPLQEIIIKLSTF